MPLPEEIDPSEVQLSFAGCGFLCIYHAGVCAAIKEYAPQLTQNKIRGSSAGAIAAAGLVCNVCMSHATSTILQVVTEARAGSLRALSPNFNLMGMVRQGLEESLPSDAHIRCTGKLFISATRARDYRNVVISEYASREELIQAILCSCFIPFYCGRTPPTYRGEHYIDGGFSDNQPGKWEEGTVTVSPFSGESDICPSDEDSASLLGFDFCGTSIQFTTQNLFRMVVTLFPPSPEVCSRICRQGFEDTLRFLTKSHMAPCVKCLTVQSNAIQVPAQTLTKEEKVPVRKISELRMRRRRAVTVASGLNLKNECERCMGPMDRFEPPRFSNIPLPSVVSSVLAEMEAKNAKSWLNWLRQWRLIRWWLRMALPPVLLPIELFQFTLNRIRSWVQQTALTPAETYLLKFQQIVDFVLQEVENRRLIYSPGIFPSAVLPVGPMSSLKLTEISDPQAQQGKEVVSVQRKISLAQKSPFERKVSTAVAPLDLAVPNGRIAELEREEEEEMLNGEDSVRVLRDFCERNDAILAYHYLDDETNEMKICQIFDVNGRQPREQCHVSTLDTPLEFSGHHGEEEAKGAEDSGLSLEEEENDGNGLPLKRKDACCSPIRHLASQLPKQPSSQSRRHTFSSRTSRLSASTRTLANPGSARQRPVNTRLFTSNSMNTLEGKPPTATMTGFNTVPRRKISARTMPAERCCSSDSEEGEGNKHRQMGNQQKTMLGQQRKLSKRAD